MDALIFFVAVIIVSSLVLGDVMSPDQMEDPLEGVNAQEMLRALLAASIGEAVVISAVGQIRLSEDATIGDCLFLELQAIHQGVLRRSFESLESVVLRAMVSITGRTLNPHIVAYAVSGTTNEQVLAIPGTPHNSSQAAAASVVIPGGPDFHWLLVLVLAPAALSELCCIPDGHLDSALRVLLPFGDGVKRDEDHRRE